MCGATQTGFTAHCSGSGHSSSPPHGRIKDSHILSHTRPIPPDLALSDNLAHAGRACAHEPVKPFCPAKSNSKRESSKWRNDRALELWGRRSNTLRGEGKGLCVCLFSRL